MREYKLHFDGACLPNPGGVASFGFLLTAEEKIIDQGYGIIGQGPLMTDVYAEYFAVSQGLASFIRNVASPEATLTVYGDSKFAIDQINGVSKLRHDHRMLRSAESQLSYIATMNIPVKVLWIPREQNEFCDSLAKKLRVMNAALGLA